MNFAYFFQKTKFSDPFPSPVVKIGGNLIAKLEFTIHIHLVKVKVKTKQNKSRMLVKRMAFDQI